MPRMMEHHPRQQVPSSPAAVVPAPQPLVGSVGSGGSGGGAELRIAPPVQSLFHEQAKSIVAIQVRFKNTKEFRFKANAKLTHDETSAVQLAC